MQTKRVNGKQKQRSKSLKGSETLEEFTTSLMKYCCSIYFEINIGNITSACGRMIKYKTSMSQQFMRSINCDTVVAQVVTFFCILKHQIALVFLLTYFAPVIVVTALSGSKYNFSFLNFSESFLCQRHGKHLFCSLCVC